MIKSAIVPGKDAWQNVLYVNWNSVNGKVKLNANWVDNHNQNWAAPVLRDCSIHKGGGLIPASFY
jgi:hypothetical protein